MRGNKMGHAILIIEDEEVLGRNMLHYLQRAGFEAQLAATAQEGLALYESMQPDAVVLDYHLPDIDGLQVLERIRALDHQARVVMLTGHGSIELAVQAMRAGSLDFLTKPVALSQLKLRLEQAIASARQDSALRYYRQRDAQIADMPGLIGESPPMLALRGTLTQLLNAEAQLRDTDAPAVLVLGETGAGKEVVARALHDGGPRREQPFVELNCAALPATLLESELFGHERGAFTDARERKLGLVETAEGGTLFLDEIGDMDIALQSKLLKLLEEKTVRRLGSVREQKVSVRVVAATHQPLEALVQEGRFRADLYYRLCVVQLHLPALRERGQDILLLARHFIALHAARYGKPAPPLTREAEAAMLAHPWPGNVRELRNVLEQAVLLNSGKAIDAPQLGLAAAPPTRAAPAAPAAPAMAPASLPEIERQALRQALQSHGWNVSRAARALGISRDTLRYRIDKHGLEADAVSGFADSQR
jgi:two-component system, NtrC family, response regulator AtoC